MQNLADDYFSGEDRPVDIIIGCKDLHRVLLGEIKVGQPLALSTVFGWVLLGETGKVSERLQSQLSTCNVSVTRGAASSCDDLLRSFWSLDVLGIVDETSSTTCQPNLLHKFESSVTRDAEGRYIAPSHGRSHQMAFNHTTKVPNVGATLSSND